MRGNAHVRPRVFRAMRRCVALALLVGVFFTASPVRVAAQARDVDTFNVVPRSYRDVLQARRNASRDSLLEELRVARDRWAARRASRVRFRVEIRCMCISVPRAPRYTIVELFGDSVLSVQDSAGRTARPMYPVEGQQSPQWLFDIAETAIRGADDRIDVIFDDALGLPLLVRTDEVFNRTDDELEIRVTHLEVLS